VRRQRSLAFWRLEAVHCNPFEGEEVSVWRILLKLFAVRVLDQRNPFWFVSCTGPPHEVAHSARTITDPLLYSVLFHRSGQAIRLATSGKRRAPIELQPWLRPAPGKTYRNVRTFSLLGEKRDVF